jgi:predicted DNA-binding transcriptional regulator AlpA
MPLNRGLNMRLKMKSLKQIDVLEAFDSLPQSANVRLPVVMGLYAISSASVWRNVKNGNIPQPRKLTLRTTVWNVGELRASLKARKV